jgi:hypothetical protein
MNQLPPSLGQSKQFGSQQPMVQEGREEKGWAYPGGRGSCSSETLVSVYQTTWHTIPEDGTLIVPTMCILYYMLFVNILL